MRRLAALAAVVLALAPAAVAGAQGSPGLGAPSAEETAPVTTESGGGGLASWQQALIFLSGIALIAGIGFAIVSDARRRAPVAERARPGGDPDDAGARHRPPPGGKGRARARGRAAREARRRNR